MKLTNCDLAKFAVYAKKVRNPTRFELGWFVGKTTPDAVEVGLPSLGW
jgi:hypothetical protein